MKPEDGSPVGSGLLVLAGWFLVLGGVLDIGLAGTPLQFGNPLWEFGAVAQTVASVTPVLVGLGLIQFTAERGIAGRWHGILVLLAGLLGLLLLGVLGVIVALSLPPVLELAEAQSPDARSGMLRAVAKTLGLGLLGGTALTVVVIRAARFLKLYSKGEAGNMTRTLRRTIGWAAVLLAGAGPAHAANGTVSFLNRCSGPTGQYACASAIVNVTGSTLTLDVWNLFGHTGAPAGALDASITSVALYLATGGTGAGTLTGVAFWNGSVTSGEYFDSDGGAKGQSDVDTGWYNGLQSGFNLSALSVAAGEENNNGIRGCSGTGGTVVGGNYYTCGAFQLRFTFNLTTAINDLSKLRFAFRAKAAPGSQLSWKCDGVLSAGEENLDECGDFPDDPPVNVVPEPASMVLLATGLIGLAGVQYRRRKNGKV